MNLKEIVPVLPSADIARDVRWYGEKVGFQKVWSDGLYAILKKEQLTIHLQWHADTTTDPLLGGSVIRIFVKNIEEVFLDFLQRKTVEENALKMGTAWNTNEFGFYDLNQNAIIFVEHL